MKRFLTFINEQLVISEGGGAQITDVPSEPIPTEHSRQATADVKATMSSINKATGHVLYGKHENALKNNSAFAGSTKAMAEKTPEELKKVKPKGFGDIDVMVPEGSSDKLKGALAVGAKHGPYTVTGIKNVGTQTHVQVKHNKTGAHHQIDLEQKSFHPDTQEPTAFSQMSNNSHWDDMKSGLKGVMHKHLLGAVTGANKHEGVVEGTKRGKPTSEAEPEIRAHTFSVAKGLREKHKPVIEGGKPKTSGGKPVYTEVKPTEAHYDTDLASIHSKLFGKKPGAGDIESMHSFHGVAKLMKKHLNPEQQRNTIHSFVGKLHDPKERMIGGDKKEDSEMKSHAIGILKQHFPEHFDKSMEQHIQNKRTEFYKSK